MQDQKKESSKPRSSTLTKGRERFLAHVIDHAFEVGRRTPEDFIRHFPPTVIMEGLKEHPALRAKILVLTTGVKEKVALKKRWESCADDLQIALEESETDAAAIISLFDGDDRIRHLDHKALWAYVTEGEFWKISPSRQKEYAAAKTHMAFMLARALEDKLLTHTDIVDGITVEELASRLPKSELGKIIKGALACGKRNAPFTETDLLGSMPPDVLVNYMPLFQVWDSIIATKIASEHDYVAKSGSAAPKSAAEAAPPGDKILDDEPPTATDITTLPSDLPKTDKSEAVAKTDKSAKAKPPKATGKAGAKAGSTEDPQTWSQEFDEDTEFVDAADLLDEEPTINSKPGDTAKESSTGL